MRSGAVALGAPRSRWAASLAVLALLLGAGALAYQDTLAGMVAIWSSSDTFAHGFLVAPISLWLIWRRRHELEGLHPRPAPMLLLPLALAGLLWVAGELVAVNAARQFGVVAMLLLAVPAVLGTEVARRLAFPLLFLFFAVPFGEFMLPAMMEGTADFVVRALRLSGVPVYREGMFIVIPSGQWSVVEECSGVRYLIASFMVGTLFAHLNYRSARRRAIFMGISLVVPVVANWLRAYLIVMVGHLSDNRLAAGVDHLIYGWVFFGVVILLMFMIGSRWAEMAPGPAGGLVATAGVIESRATAPAWAVAAVAAAIGLAPQAAIWAFERGEPDPALLQMPAMPAALGSWEAATASVPAWEPQLKNPSARAAAAYAGAKGTVGVHLAYFRGSSPERKLVTSSHRLLARQSPGWVGIERGRVSVGAGNEAVFSSSELLGAEALGSAARAPVVVWKSYWIDGRFVAGDVRAKLVQAWARLRGRGDEGAIVVFYAQQPTAAASQAAIRAFVTDHLAQIDALLQHAWASGRAR